MKQDTSASQGWKQRVQARTRQIHRNIEAARLRRARRHRKPQYTYCKNCGMKLKGMYCHRCGQYALDIYQPFWKYIQQYFENVYQFDTKIWQTLRLMCTRPGFLTREFNAGKINSYVHPFRLYMCISVVFFTVFFMIVEHYTNRIVSLALTEEVSDQLVKQLNTQKPASDTAVYVYSGKEFLKALVDRGVEHTDSLIHVVNMYTPQGLSLMQIPHVLLDSCLRQVRMDSIELAEIRKIQQDLDHAQPNEMDMGEFYLQTGSPINLEELKDAYRHFQTDSAGGTYPPVYQWSPEADTSQLYSIDSTMSFTLGQLSKWTPLYLMFLLPLFALLLKRAYRKQHMPYMWHFAHAVHINTVFLLLLPIPLGITVFSMNAQCNFEDALPLKAIGGFFAAVFVYTYLSMHTVYRNGWIRTFFKTLFVFGTFSFIALLIAAILIVWLATSIADKL